MSSAFNLNLFSDIDNISLLGSHLSDLPHFVKLYKRLKLFLFSAHSLGCFHEHSRLDRDKYVTIEWRNIMEGEKS